MVCRDACVPDFRTTACWPYCLNCGPREEVVASARRLGTYHASSERGAADGGRQGNPCLSLVSSFLLPDVFVVGSALTNYSKFPLRVHRCRLLR